MTHHAPERRTRPAWLRPGSMEGVTAELAPAVDPRWADDFILELRLLDVPGRAIGDALVEVGSHCTDSGDSAQEAFGDPVAYARSLDLPNVPLTRADLGPVLPWVLQPIGLLLVAEAASTLRTGGTVDLTAGLVTIAGVVVLSIVALLRWFDPVVRVVVGRPVVAWLAMMAHLAVLVVLGLVFRDVVATVPGALALTVGIVLIVVGTVWELIRLRGEAGDDDPITATVDGDGPRAGERRRTAWGLAALRYGGALLVPVAAVVLVALQLVVL